MDSAFVKVTVNNCVTSCTNWLNLPNNTSYVRMGDLDIPGNVITVEAMFNRTTTWSGGTPYSGDLVSKHIDPNDVNYLLRPHNASITTNNGFFETPAACDIELNKTYHAAMVYDGSTLKFYRDGFLMAQVPASGNLIQNNWPAQIGKYTGNNLETFIGYINEVRIWNVPRSQAEIRQYMNAPIPSPTIQTGLLAYYTFDNTLNKQGNTTWNGTLANGASINATNTNCAYTADSCKKVVVQFTTPDTVCVNTPVTITNTSAGASSYYWNFCVADINTPPAAVNIGNPGNLSSPVFLDYVYVNNNYYGFVTNYNSGNLIRLDFGNSLLNTPTSVNLGNYGGILQTGTAIEGIQVVQNEGRWYAIIVGGTPLGGTQPRIVKIDFGTSITNTGVATNWGNIGNMNQAVDLHIFKENNNWYGFTINAENNTITRFNFTNSFNNTPTATNLGNIGSLAYPTGIYAINDNGFWRVFITNAGDNTRIGPNSSLTRLDFGSSLLNTPTGVNLGNPGNLLQHPRDLTIMKFCGDIVGFAVNGNPNYNNVVRLNFSNDLTLTPTATSLGNTGNLNFPHSISKLFRVNDDVYAFITNVANNTITRLRFAGCTNASVSSSTAQNPQPVTYSAPGTYNINLTIDDGLPTQTSYCKQVVVMPEPIHTPTQAITICTGDSIKIGTGVKYAQYTWNTGAITDSIIANTAGTYWVQTDRYGCTNKDSMEITEIPKPLVDLGPDVTLCEFSNQVLDAGNTGATYLWQDGYTNQTYTATVFGKYYVRVTNPNGCVSSDTITFTKTLITHPIISSTQDVCDPLTIQFNGTGAGLANPWWDFGDGATATGQFNPTHTYAGYGNYTVKFAATVNGCKDTVTQMISVHISTTNLILTPDTTICYNTPKQLRTQPLLGFCWSPTTWLNDPTSPNPVTSTPGKMTYYLTAQVPGANLITNGDFSNGNTGFISTYRYNNPNSIEGEYTVGTNPKTWNNFFGNCVDHTTGNGNMLLVNGAPTPNEVVWSQTVNNIMPNTDYALIAWVQNLNVSGATSNPPTLEFTINGNRLLNVLQPGYTSCVWDRYYTVWNSGASTTANIVLTDLSSIRAGNDFALDDLSFSPISLQRDSVIISVDTPVVMARTDTTVCINAQVQLSATGAATWAWTPVIGLSGATISNPVATVTSNTAYIVAGTTTNGCTAKDTVNINIHPVPTVITDHDLEACPNTAVQLSANSTMSSWSWTPALYVSDATIANPMAAPPHTLTYSVQVKDQYNCAYSDTVQVTLYDPRFTLQGLNRAICKGSSIGLHVTGGDTYLWSPAGSLSDASVANPVATPDTSTTYQVYAKENTCGYDTTMQIRVNVNPTPIVTASKENDVNCVVHTTRLHASGTPGTSYLWAPVTGLDHPNLPDPVSGPDSTTTYFVTGTNQYGCYAIDSVTVYAEAEGKVTFMVPNAFTPNGDSRNDCFGVKSWGGATIEEFTIFNRWGQRVFSSKNATACWDGRYKGEPQPAGGYVYVIKAKTFCGNIKRTGTLVLVR
jgi:gliding motility-associated-like protein